MGDSIKIGDFLVVFPYSRTSWVHDIFVNGKKPPEYPPGEWPEEPTNALKKA